MMVFIYIIHQLMNFKLNINPENTTEEISDAAPNTDTV